MAEESKHLTYFKVENFKCFDSFEMEDIGQFNLILGDNNVGKTSVLEALLFDENYDDRLNEGNLILIFEYKSKLAGLLDNTDAFNDTVLYTALKFFLNKIGSENIVYTLTKGNSQPITKSLNIGIRKIESPYYQKYIGLPLVYSDELYNYDLSEYYSSQIQIERTKKGNLVDGLKPIIPKIENVEIFILESQLDPIIVIQTLDNEKAIPLSNFGDGAIKLFRILIEIVRLKDKRLMIDEIDSGIHYSRFKAYWRTIIKSAIKNNVQLFMTTHNFECLKYLKEVLEEEDMKQYQEKMRSYTMQKLPDGHVKSYKYVFDQFEYSIQQGIEIR